MSKPTRTFAVGIEEALGPGLDCEPDANGGIRVVGSRRGGLWMGVDRGSLIDSDDGRGRLLPVLAVLDASSFRGARIDAEIVGGFSSAAGPVLVGRLPGATVPVEPILRAAGGVNGDARWMASHAASERAAAARRVFRQRRGRGRITGGLAWRPPDDLSAEALQTGGSYSTAERSLDRLAPRYLRALEGLLDNAERLHYSIQRPWRLDAGLLTRMRGVDRRSGLLLLTDRQVLWLTDHSNPDSYLSDWGVDVELVPVEQLVRIEASDTAELVRLDVSTRAGTNHVSLPIELEREVRVFESLAQRFLAERNLRRLRRTYEAKPVEFVEETAARFGQLEEALEFQRQAREEAGEVLAFLYSPRRQGQREPLALWLGEERVGLLARKPARLVIGDLITARMALSPLTAGIELRSRLGTIKFPYPGPLAAHGATFIRCLRQVWADQV